MESITLSRDPRLRGEQKSKAERFEGCGFEIRLQQVRENLQGDHVSEPTQTARVRCHTLRSLPDLRPKIQASFRIELAHRWVPEKIAAHYTENRWLACIHRGTGVRISSFLEMWSMRRKYFFFFLFLKHSSSQLYEFLILNINFFFIFLYFAARVVVLFLLFLSNNLRMFLECVFRFDF